MESERYSHSNCQIRRFPRMFSPFAKGGLVCSFLEYTLMRIDYAALKLRLTVRAANILPATAAATGAGKALPICR